MATSEHNKGKKTIVKLEKEEDVAVALAKYTADLSERFIRHKGSISVVLSGGSLIDTMRFLTQPPYKETVDWSKWSIFWVDERVVPLSADDSNFKLAYDGFLSKVPIPSEAIYAIDGKLSAEGAAEGAAEEYEHRIKQLVHKGILPLSHPHGHGFPKFDLMLLGMGPDGHVASLFPNRTQKFEMKKWVTYITDSPKPPPPRITFTFPVINAATEIAMVVTGAEVAHAVHQVLEAENSDLPAAKVRAEDRLTWFLDREASTYPPISH